MTFQWNANLCRQVQCLPHDFRLCRGRNVSTFLRSSKNYIFFSDLIYLSICRAIHLFSSIILPPRRMVSLIPTYRYLTFILHFIYFRRLHEKEARFQGFKKFFKQRFKLFTGTRQVRAALLQLTVHACTAQRTHSIPERGYRKSIHYIYFYVLVPVLCVYIGMNNKSF